MPVTHCENRKNYNKGRDYALPQSITQVLSTSEEMLMVSLLEIRPLGPLKYSMHKCWKVLTEMKMNSLVQITKNMKCENKNRLSPL